MASVVSDNGHEIRFYDLDHPDRAPQRVPGRGEPHALAVSPDGRLVAVTTESGTVRLCNAVTGQLIQDLLGHLNAAIGVAFSKDGRRLISTGGGCVKLWDVGTGRELLKFLGKVQTPGSGSYVADGQGLGRANWIADGDTILAGRPWQAWRAPSWEEIAAAEAKNPPSPGYGGQGNAEAQPP